MTICILFGYELEDAVKVTLYALQLAYIRHPDILTIPDSLQDSLQVIVCLEQV